MNETTEENTGGTTEVTDAGAPAAVQNLPLLPLTSGVVLPGMVFTMALESDEARAATEAAKAAAGRFVIVPFIDGKYASVGAVAEVMEAGELPGGMPAVAVRGVERARLGTAVPGTGHALWVEVEVVPEGAVTEEAIELAREYRAVVENILLSRGAGRLAERLAEVTEPGRVADMAGYSPDLSLAQKVQVLETLDVAARLRLVIAWSREVLADLTLRERIKTDVEEGMEKTQREFLLRRQLESIKKELGQMGSGEDGEPDDYRTRLADRQLPEAVAKAVEREIDKLERMSEQNPEHGWIRTWLDTVFELPWSKESEDRLDVAEAARILDEDHDGLTDVKDRILEHLAVRKLQSERGWPRSAVAAQGHPGPGRSPRGGQDLPGRVGGPGARPFVRPGGTGRGAGRGGDPRPPPDLRGGPARAAGPRLAGGRNHEPGHPAGRGRQAGRRLPGRSILGPARGAGPGSEPHVPRPLPGSRAGPVQGPVHGYGQHGRHHPGSVAGPDGGHPSGRVHRGREGGDRPPPPGGAAAGTGRAEPEDVTVTDGALRAIVGDYTREAGVRSLERELGRLLRKVAARIASDPRPGPISVDADDVREWLGRPRFFFESADRTAVPGVATGLAVTGTGGDVLYVEATMMDGPEGLTLTGQLGDVMKESAEIALSYVRSHAAELGIDPVAFTGKRFHLHVPAGAIPKDGPSAGVTMTTALVSLLPRPPGALRAGNDRRGHAAGPGPAHRRGPSKGVGRPPGRADLGGASHPERSRPRGRPRAGPGGDDLPPGLRHHRGARCRPGPRRPDRGRRWAHPPRPTGGGLSLPV